MIFIVFSGFRDAGKAFQGEEDEFFGFLVPRPGSLLSFLQPRVQGVSDSFAEEVVTKNSYQDRQ
ncbi:MAG: hypothetical protein P8Z70_02665, partial [Desulfuromonadales bacterium]